MVTYPKDWEKNNIGNCVSILQGGTPSTTNTQYWNGDIIWITPGEITKLRDLFVDNSERKITTQGLNNSSATILPIGTILLCTRATIGELAITAKPCTTNQGFKNLVCNRNYHNVYFAYLLRTLKNEMISKSIGTTFLELSKKELSRIEVYLPKFPEQEAIANAIRSFDIYINDLTELIEKKRGIRDGALEDLMNQRTRINGHSAEWEEVSLSEICKVYDGTHQTPKYTLQGIRFVSVENIMDLYSSNKYISQAAYESDFKAYPEKGDILMTRIGDIGTPCVIDRDEPLAYYVSLALFKNISINSYFLNYYIMSSEFQSELDDRTLHHATPKKINKGEIGKCKVKYPKDADEQAAIAKILQSMDEEINALEIERDKIIQIREGAMDDLLTGRIRLRYKEAQDGNGRC